MLRLIPFSLSALLLGGCYGEGPSGPWPPLQAANFETVEFVQRWPVDIVSGAVSDKLLVIGDGSGVFKSEDAGKSWSKLGIPGETEILALAISPTSGELVAVSDNGEVYRSSDNGQTLADTNLYASLPVDMEALAKSWDPFGLDNVKISNDLQHWVVVGFCEAFISHDGGNSWTRITGNDELGSWNHPDLCLSELITDEHYEPQFASLHITGRLASGEYVFALKQGRWQELCSFDTVAYLLDSVSKCSEHPEVTNNARLFAQSGLYRGPWDDQSDPDIGVFEGHHFPLKADLDLSLTSSLISDERGKFWYVSTLGVAASSDRGEQWETLLGGIALAERKVAVAPSEFVALWDDQVYHSTDNKIWQRDSRIDYAYDFLPLMDAALVASGDSVFRLSEHQAMSAVLQKTTYRLRSTDGNVWALGDETLAASADQGLTWHTAEAEFYSDEWRCADVCLAVDDDGQAWEAVNTGESLQLARVGGLPEAVSEDQYVDRSWAADDLSLLIVGVVADLNDLTTLWVSADQGRSFTQFPTPVQYLDHIVFPAPGFAFLEGGQRAHWIRDYGAVMTSERSPVPNDAGVACTPAPSVIVLETWDVHPNWPEEENEYIVYTNDLGETWWTTRLQGSVCPWD